jgi:hypothetical protein
MPLIDCMREFGNRWLADDPCTTPAESRADNLVAVN